MGLSDRISSFVAFFRAGYPDAAPRFGYAPLLALLPRRVSDDEIALLARKLTGSNRRRMDTADVGVEITRITDELPLPKDIERVRSRLSTIGGPDAFSG
jgi:Protein of unknown function (DUF3349)